MGIPSKVLQIGIFPPPLGGWSIHTQKLHEALVARGTQSQVLDIGPSRRIGGRDCETCRNGLEFVAKLVRYRARGYTFHAHVNGDSWKGYVLALTAVMLGRLTGRPPLLTFHAGPSQEHFPRSSGLWYWAFRLLFTASGHVICNHEPVRQLIVGYGLPPSRVHAIPAYSVQYCETVDEPLPPVIEAFRARHSPLIFCYALFRPEFTVDILLEAVGRLRATHRQLGLLLVGPADVPDRITQQLSAVGLQNAVLVAGNLPHSQFLAATARADVVVRTHLRDGVCSSVLEALALGVPVVAADDGIRPPSVVTYRPSDARDLESRLATVLRDLQAARANVIRPHVEDHLARQVDVVLRAAS